MQVSTIGLASIIASALLCAPPAHADEATVYTYDALGRLIKVQKAGTALTSGQVVDTQYDPAGNRANYAVNGAVPIPTVSLTNSPAVSEGGMLTFNLAMSPASTSVVTVSYATANGTAISPINYAASNGTVSFAPNQTSAQVAVTTANDYVQTPSLAMTITISAPSSNAILGATTATGTIENVNRFFIVVPLNGYSLIPVGQ